MAPKPFQDRLEPLRRATLESAVSREISGEQQDASEYMGYPVRLSKGEARLLLGLLRNPDLAFTDIEYMDSLKEKLGAVL